MQEGKMIVWGGLTNSWKKEERWKVKEEGKDILNWMQSSKEEQGNKDKQDKKAFLSEQCKEIEENNRNGKD